MAGNPSLGALLRVADVNRDTFNSHVYHGYLDWINWRIRPLTVEHLAALLAWKHMRFEMGLGRGAADRLLRSAWPHIVAYRRPWFVQHFTFVTLRLHVEFFLSRAREMFPDPGQSAASARGV